MNCHRGALILTAGAALLALLSACAQSPMTETSSQSNKAMTDIRSVLTEDLRPFNPRDLNGIWTRGHPSGGMGGAESCVNGSEHSGPCGDRGYSQDWPSFTEAGKKAFDANKPSYGRRLGSEDAAAHPKEHIGRRRSVQAGIGNDPQGTCNPLGVTRAVIYPQENELVMVEDRILQHFSQTNAWRSIWTDGRRLPAIDDLAAPLWYGYSVGSWEGDTLVVQTIGQDDRIWLDHFGYPLSDEAHLEERYQRTSFSTLELNMTLTDPKYYTKPWKSQTKKFLWRPKDYFKNSNWPGLYYDDCAPLDEVDVFKSLIVDPAAKQMSD